MAFTKFIILHSYVNLLLHIDLHSSDMSPVLRLMGVFAVSLCEFMDFSVIN